MEGIAVDHAGTIYCDCDDHAVREISPAGAMRLFAGGKVGYADGPAKQAKVANIDNIALGPAQELYVDDLANHALPKVMPDGTVTTLIAGDKDISIFDIPDDQFWPRGLAVARDGSVYASSGNAVFKISLKGVAQVYAGGGPGFADGEAAAAHFKRPTSLALDGKGNLFVLDEGNEAIWEIRVDGRVTTVMARRRPPGTEE